MTGYYAPQRPSRTERVLTSLVVLAVVVCRRVVLGHGWADDKRHTLAQRRGERLAREMSRDGSLKARSPRKVVRLP